MEAPFPVPASLAPGFVCSPMTYADTDAAAVVYHESFGADPANTYWWPRDLAPLLAWCSGRMRIKLDDPFVRIFKITDAATGDMVAYARWDVPKDSTKFGAWIGGGIGKADVTALVESNGQTAAADQATKQQPLTADDKAAPAVGDYPEGGNHEIANMFFSALGESQKKWKTDDMLGLSLLCVSPKHHRKGMATALLSPMLDIADAEGRKTYLEATAAGRPLYERLGFREVEVLRFDFDALTKERNGLYKNFIMIREPVAKT